MSRCHSDYNGLLFENRMKTETFQEYFLKNLMCYMDNLFICNYLGVVEEVVKSTSSRTYYQGLIDLIEKRDYIDWSEKCPTSQ